MARRRGATASGRVHGFVAPVKGWYVGINVAETPPGHALVMDNWFPRGDRLRLRRGSRTHVTGLPASAVLALIPYEVQGAERLFAVAGSGIYDVTSVGAVGAPVVTGLTSADVITALFTTTGGTSFLVAVNGADDRRLYDGTTWGTAPAITGVASSQLSHVWTYRNRLFFVQKDTLNAWYLPTDSIGGAATVFPLGGLFKRGGSLIAGAAWSLDTNASMDEACVFLSSQGEVAVYTGSDPSSPTNWTLKGVYDIGRPLGRRCFLKAGGDLAVMTEFGLIPLSQAMALDPAALRLAAVTRPIDPVWRDVVRDRATLPGWQVTLWPRESMAIVNLPLASGSGEQFVANAATGAWCRFTGWPATSFAVFRNRLFFGTQTGSIIEADVDGTDRGAAYSCAVVTPFDDCGTGPAYKVASLVRPMIESAVPVAPAVTVSADYLVDLPAPPPAGGQLIPGAQWGTAVWGVDTWPGGVVARGQWQAVEGDGSALAVALQITNATDIAPDCTLSRIDMVLQSGGVVV